MKFKLSLILFSFLFTLSSQAQLKYTNNDTSAFLKIMIVGDLSINEKVLAASYSEARKQYDFQYIFHYIRPVLNLGDIVIGQIDHSFTDDKDFLKDNLNVIPQEYGIALKYAGFNLLMNANRSAVAQELDDWQQNHQFLEEINISQIGSFEHEDDRYKRNPTILEKYGIKVAVLNYMDGLPYFPELSPLINGVNVEQIQRDLILAKNRGADYTIVYFNWGSTFESKANYKQEDLAKYCIDNGANIVVGTNGKKMQNIIVEDHILNGRITQNITAYSLGSFVGTDASPLNNSASILEIILEKKKADNITVVNDIGYIPTYTALYEENERARFAIMPVSQVEKNNVLVPINNTEKQWMRGATENTRHLFSGKIKEIEYELSDEIIDDVAEVLTVKRKPLNEDDDFALGINNHLLLGLSGFLEEENTSQPITYTGIVYKVQFLSLRREIPIDVEYYTHLKGYETYFEDDYYHYVIGNYKNLKQANDFCLDVKRNGHKYAYVVAFENGVKK